MSTAAMEERPVTDPGRPRPQLDRTLVMVAALLAAFGLLMIMSASSLMADAQFGDALRFVTRQGAGLVLGGLAGLGATLIPTRKLAPWAVWAYLLSLVGLVLVFTPFGREVNGATRWIALGGLSIQPSELAKVALVLWLGRYLAANEGRLRELTVILPAAAAVVPMVILLALEPDFGSVVLVAGLTLVMLIVAGMPKRWVALFVLLALVCLGGLVVLEPYRMARLASYLDPLADPEGGGYQVVQGWIALASGGWTGQGLATGVAQRGFLPEAHTDFISAVVAEELGAVGWFILVFAYAVLAWRGLAIATRARDLFGMVVAMGLTSLLAAQAIVNLGVVVGWVPAKGLVLPFVSYGATAAVVHGLCIGLLLRIGLEATPPRRDRVARGEA